MSVSVSPKSALVLGIAVFALLGARPYSQTGVVDPAGKDLPNPNPIVNKGWGPLPDGRTWGSSAGVDIGPDGHVWAYDRCGAVALAGGCDANNVDPILKFDRTTGKVLASFGKGLFVLPHGLHVDRDGNVWVTDSMGNKAGTKGHQVIKFSPKGDVLMKLGKAGVAGSGPDVFNETFDVITAPNGDIFVSDGHSGQNDDPPATATGRIMKFSKDGKFIKQWGKIGTGRGEFRTPHALAFDSRGRLFVADRGNHRIQIFDQDGKYLESFHQFSRISGLFVTPDDTLYAIDSESSPERHPNWKTGVRIGKTNADKVTAFIPPHPSKEPQGVAGEGIAVDRDGNVYAAEGPISRADAGGGLTKYSKRAAGSTAVRVVSDVDYVASAEYPDKKDRLDIYAPENASMAPVILSIHGGGLRAGDKSQQTFVGQRFASAGHVTVVVNHRLSPSVTHPAHIEDIAASVAWVKKNIAKYGGDPQKLFVIGHSAGAYLAGLLVLDPRYLAAHGLTPRDIRGVVPVSGFFYVNRPGVAPDRPKDTWGTDVNVWNAASPATYLSANVPPLLLLYADGDDEWRRKQQDEFANALRGRGSRAVEVQMIKGRTHNTVWNEMAKGDEDTSRAILQFVNRLAKTTSH